MADDDDLLDIKYQLKKWENSFVKKNNRKPNKDDIDAEQEIKEAYKRYTDLKREKSQKKTEIWGEELNKKPKEECAKENIRKDVTKPAKQLSTAMQSIASKLRNNTSSFKSGTLRRGIGRNRDDVFGPCKIKPSKENLEPEASPESDGIHGDEPTQPFSDAFGEEDDQSNTSKIAAMANKFLHNRQTSIKKTEPREPSFKPIEDEPSRTFVDKFDTLPSSLAISKSGLKSKFSLNSFSRFKADSDDHNSDADEKAVLRTGSDADNEPRTMFEEIEEYKVTNFNGRAQSERDGEEICQKVDSDDSNVAANKDTSFSNTGHIQRANRRGRGRGRGGNISALGGRKRPPPTRQEDDMEIGSTCPGDISSPPAKRRAVGRNADRDSDVESTGSTCEVGWMSDQPQIPDGFEEEVNEETESTATPSSGGFKATHRKSSSKPLNNDNFIRLNMKVKSYRRRGQGGMRGERYKRIQWKQKMKARSESYGNKCFKCGQEGHWASKCKGARKSAAQETQNNKVTDEEFPTMRDALNMSRGIKAKPKVKREKQGKEEAEKERGIGEFAEDDDVELEIVRGTYEAPAPPPAMDALYQRNADGSLPEPTKEVMAAMKKFGYSGFRGGQQEAVMRILCGESTLVVLSTGSGKSLCYQLPAYIYAQRHQCITLVISPLVSLMEDQVTGLPPGLKGACLHTNMTKGQREKVIAYINDGKIHFLLISPEALVGTGGGGFIPGLSKLPPIAFACIDEVHCVSEWSHHFRPSYLRVCKILRERLGVQCLLGLTATATMSTAISVAQHLGIDDPESSTIRGTPVPNNLLLSVSRDEDRDRALIQLLQGERFTGCDSIIIYCTRRQQTERLATLIRTNLQNCDTGGGSAADKALKKGKRGISWDAEAYHAGLSAAKRRSVQNGFMCGKLRIVVATVAFGMGLDKRDVRAIIHYTLPKGFESYVQEIGRAGRDGKAAHCHVFLDEEGSDMNELKKHVFANTVDRVVLKKLVRKLFTRCRCREIHERVKEFSQDDVDKEETDESASVRVCPGHERALPIESTVMSLDVREEVLSTLLCYLELHPSRWIKNLPSTYATCTLQCYGGPVQLQQVAKKCPPVAVAIAREKKAGVSHTHCSKLTFPVIEIADSMGWEAGPVKRELKMLQWNVSQETGQAQKSGVMVEMEDLSFHFRSPGDLSDDELEEITNFLSERMNTQEASELNQLHHFYNTLACVAHKNHWMCSDRIDMDRCEKLRGSIRKYFIEGQSLESSEVTPLTFRAEHSNTQGPSICKLSGSEESQLRGDIRGFINQYSHEHTLSGRAIARVFHGIGSPCFPAEVWGKVRRFWRSHLHTDFNLVRKLATEALIGR